MSDDKRRPAGSRRPSFKANLQSSVLDKIAMLNTPEEGAPLFHRKPGNRTSWLARVADNYKLVLPGYAYACPAITFA